MTLTLTLLGHTITCRIDLLHQRQAEHTPPIDRYSVTASVEQSIDEPPAQPFGFGPHSQ